MCTAVCVGAGVGAYVSVCCVCVFCARGCALTAACVAAGQCVRVSVCVHVVVPSALSCQG